MAYSGDILKLTAKAGSNAKTTTSQYQPAYLSAADTYSVCNTTTQFADAIIESYQSSGSESLSVVIKGITKCKVGVTCTAGDLLTVASGGGAVGGTTKALTTTTLWAFGQALQTGITSQVISIEKY